MGAPPTWAPGTGPATSPSAPPTTGGDDDRQPLPRGTPAPSPEPGTGGNDPCPENPNEYTLTM